MSQPPQIYKATYSGVPVYEMICKDIAVMKRRSDGFLNATQILKVAEFDKPQRTRILEREVQTGPHEKVQGGYGKYQGTWVPFERGVALAEQYQVDILLRPILDYVQGDVSPPLAPKHMNNLNPKPKKMKSIPKKKKITKKIRLDHDLDEATAMEEGMADQLSLLDDNRGQKRKRPLFEDEQHLMFSNDRPTYAQQLLQYFISDDSGIPTILLERPPDLDVNVIIDDEGHTSLHWAAAMGRLKLVKLLIEQGADIYRVNYKGQTALMRSVLFTNNFDSKSFVFLINMLMETVFNIDKKDQTVFHHVASTASWKGKVHASRYYMECLIETVGQHNVPQLISILNVQDIYGDTALNIAARIGNKKIVRLLMEAGASAEIANEEGMTAKDYLAEAERTGQSRTLMEPYRTETKQRTVLRQRIEELFKTIIVNDKPPILSQLFDGFAGNYERDLIQKDHLIKEKKNDLVLAKKRLAGTQHTLEQIQFDPARLVEVEEESVRLSTLLLKQTQKLQKETLEQMIEQQQQKEQKDEPSVIKEELESLQNELERLQELRKKRVQELHKLKLQTPSEKHQKYKRLISMCCNVSYENVDLMLLPLLSSFDELLFMNKE
ncbi:apses-domain-containing protein [Rhizopus microsporus var. microsporus]|uniref:Apses-domain-containing protein n=2 Tax=Rhizopus microsporus TaxID=58291 RepID=A0A2G4T8T8_RHIZD|nr:apses-domain-containing protein [Rhizopus microsporus ATCC 52813]ORE11933.1 apses-domain-containing protein [Rhizopus microsporus var. microsporus]PHZ17428.1 apses-domain-containing protein [Rhizopus microsporus ATCC 52813]